MPANKKVKSNTPTTTTATKNSTQQKNTHNEQPALSSDLKSKIIRWKEMFPQYRQSTNEDIIAIFEEYNDNFEAAVDGALNGLLTNKPGESWQSVGQKKKPTQKTRGQRTQATNQKNYKTANDNTNNNRKNVRGQSNNRGSSSSVRGNSSSRNTEQKKQINTKPQTQAPVPVVVAGTTKPAPTQQPNQPTSVQKITPQSNTPTTSTSSSVTPGKLSYANVAKSRPPWNPTLANKSTTDKVTSTVVANEAASTTSPRSTSNNVDNLSSTDPSNLTTTSNVNIPSSTPSNVQSTPSTQSTQSSSPSSSFTAPQSSNIPSTSVQQPIEEISQTTTQPPVTQKPIEKPRVGVLLPGDFSNDDSMSFQFGNLGILDEELSARNSVMESDLSSAQNSQSSAKVSTQVQQQNKVEQEPENMPPMGMHYTPQYPMYPMDSDNAFRGHPMAFYNPETYQHGYSREGKYQRNNSGNQNGSGRDNASKFNTDQSTQPSQPFHYGYPMYPYQFPTGSYNLYGYSSYPKGFPFAQNFGNAGMAYDERVQGQYYPTQQDQQSGSLRDSTGKQSNQSNTKSNAQSKQQQSNPQMEGNFSQGDFYEPYSHLMSGPPFYPGAPVNQSYHPQSQQSGGSRSNY